jgi:hypothetical protein
VAEQSSVIVQARVPRSLAESALEDALTLGLEGTSEAIREGLRLLHEKARLHALALDYDAYYAGEAAPLSEVTAALHRAAE